MTQDESKETALANHRWEMSKISPCLDPHYCGHFCSGKCVSIGRQKGKAMTTDRDIPESVMQPCPFCGADATDPYQEKPVPGKTTRPRWEVGCSCYCVKIYRGSKKEVVGDWNKRTEGTVFTELWKARAKSVEASMGTAESLVRELARALEHAEKLLGTRPMLGFVFDKEHGGRRHWSAVEETVKVINAALSRIPAHLRAPETTRQKEKS